MSYDHQVLIYFPVIILLWFEDFLFILCFYCHLLCLTSITIFRRFDILDLNFFDKHLIWIFFNLMFLFFFLVIFLFSLLFAFVHDLLMKLVNQEVKDSEKNYFDARKPLNDSNLFQWIRILWNSRYLYEN